MKLFLTLMLVGLIGFYSYPQSVKATDGAEVFDIKKGEVLATIPYSDGLRNQIIYLLSSVKGVVKAVKIEPRDGIGIKVKLAPPQKVQSKWIKGTVTEIVILVGRNRTFPPTMLVYLKDSHSLALHIRGENLAYILKRLNLYSSDLYLGTKNGLIYSLEPPSTLNRRGALFVPRKLACIKTYSYFSGMGAT